MESILSVDPGVTSGWVFMVKREKWKIRAAGEAVWPDLREPVDYIQSRPDRLLIEQVQQLHPSANLKVALFVTGVLLWHAQQHGVETHLRAPAFLKKGRLLATPFSIKSPHIEDALAHALVYQLSMKGGST